MNCVCLVGKVFDMPDELKESNGLKFKHFRLACQKQNNDETKTEVFDVVLFNKQADIEIKMNDLVEVTGRLNANNYEKDGVVRYNCQICANAIAIID